MVQINMLGDLDQEIEEKARYRSNRTTPQIKRGVQIKKIEENQGTDQTGGTDQENRENRRYRSRERRLNLT